MPCAPSLMGTWVGCDSVSVNTPVAYIHMYRAPLGHLGVLGEACKPTQNVRAIVLMAVRRHSRRITVRLAAYIRLAGAYI